MIKKTFALLTALALASVCVSASAETPAVGDSASATQLAHGGQRYRYVRAKIVRYQVSGNGLKITLNRGSALGVKMGATGLVYRDSNVQKPLRVMGSKVWFRITKVSQRMSEAYISEITIDQLNKARYVDIRVPR